MNNIAIRVEGLGKQYRIGGKRERYRTLRETLTDAVTAPFRRAGRLLRGQAYGAAGLEETIWALKDVSFEVKHGEVVGIIGRNGAGKSTLLKVLSRITEPTEGYADVYGRVGSLLEVGTGFHPELTGRENIYLNGAILGMTRAEIDRKFDEIVDFAEIEKFIDTPVKHYSSGMGLRLGFAVAAHLEPEILVVDEVLAVGDAAFQKKCLGKMGEVAGEGRTVLFVSHNMAAIEHLCRKVILLDSGKLSHFDETNEVVKIYLEHIIGNASIKSQLFPIFNSDKTVGITSVDASVTRQTQNGSHSLAVEIRVIANRSFAKLGVGISLATTQGVVACALYPSMTNHVITDAHGEYRCRFTSENINQYLAGGRYYINAWLSLPKIGYLAKIEQAAIIDIPAVDVFSAGIYYELRHGIVPVPMTFTVD